MHFPVINCLHIVHLIQQKMNLCCRGKVCLKRFCKDLKDLVTEIINYEKKRNDTINK